ncbi:MAG: DUF983 domain-containing protein [Acetobacteraceae bacterium]
MATGSVSTLQASVTCRCPRCGRGRLFRRWLEVRDACEVCGLDLRQSDSGDGAIALVILVLGAVIVGLAFWVEFRFEPPLWLHAVLWPVVTIPLAVLIMRPTKAALIALQYRHRATEMGL